MQYKGSCHCGKVTWEFKSKIESITACNCTICRRYGALWAYGFQKEDVFVAGETTFYTRGSAIEFHFCKTCGCITHYLAQKLDKDGRRKMVVNTRLIDDPEVIAHLPIDHFEGLVTFEDLPRDGRCVKDLWF